MPFCIPASQYDENIHRKISGPNADCTACGVEGYVLSGASSSLNPYAQSGNVPGVVITLQDVASTCTITTNLLYSEQNPTRDFAGFSISTDCSFSGDLLLTFTMPQQTSEVDFNNFRIISLDDGSDLTELKDYPTRTIYARVTVSQGFMALAGAKKRINVSIKDNKGGAPCESGSYCSYVSEGLWGYTRSCVTCYEGDYSDPKNQCKCHCAYELAVKEVKGEEPPNYSVQKYPCSSDYKILWNASTCECQCPVVCPQNQQLTGLDCSCECQDGYEDCGYDDNEYPQSFGPGTGKLYKRSICCDPQFTKCVGKSVAGNIGDDGKPILLSRPGVCCPKDRVCPKDNPKKCCKEDEQCCPNGKCCKDCNSPDCTACPEGEREVPVGAPGGASFIGSLSTETQCVPDCNSPLHACQPGFCCTDNIFLDYTYNYCAPCVTTTTTPGPCVEPSSTSSAGYPSREAACADLFYPDPETGVPVYNYVYFSDLPDPNTGFILCCQKGYTCCGTPTTPSPA